MASEEPEDGSIPADAILSEESIAAGVEALESIHGRHLADMNADEQAEARDHWRRQVEQVLDAVRVPLGGRVLPGAGRAVTSFTDAGDDRIDVGVAFQPDLEDMGDGQVAGTPAQVLALSALEALGEDEEDGPGLEEPGWRRGAPAKRLGRCPVAAKRTPRRRS